MLIYLYSYIFRNTYCYLQFTEDKPINFPSKSPQIIFQLILPFPVLPKPVQLIYPLTPITVISYPDDPDPALKSISLHLSSFNHHCIITSLNENIFKFKVSRKWRGFYLETRLLLLLFLLKENAFYLWLQGNLWCSGWQNRMQKRWCSVRKASKSAYFIECPYSPPMFLSAAVLRQKPLGSNYKFKNCSWHEGEPFSLVGGWTLSGYSNLHSLKLINITVCCQDPENHDILVSKGAFALQSLRLSAWEKVLLSSAELSRKVCIRLQPY